MTPNDLLGLVASYTYAISLLIIGEVLRRFCGWSPELTRKLIHISAGMWVFGTLGLFNRWEIGIVPFITFIPLNYLFYRDRSTTTVRRWFAKGRSYRRPTQADLRHLAFMDLMLEHVEEIPSELFGVLRSSYQNE